VGLDASVFCDCYETGKTRCAPPQPELVYVDENGQVCLRWDAPGADEHRFDDWLANACEHGPSGELVSHRLGNVSLIGFVRRVLWLAPDRYPVLLAKIVYDGAHAGDGLSLSDTRELLPEIDEMRRVQCGRQEDQELLKRFADQMAELAEASIAIGKPIVFL
jgi:hypothetical protein